MTLIERNYPWSQQPGLYLGMGCGKIFGPPVRASKHNYRGNDGCKNRQDVIRAPTVSRNDFKVEQNIWHNGWCKITSITTIVSVCIIFV